MVKHVSSVCVVRAMFFFLFTRRGKKERVSDRNFYFTRMLVDTHGICSEIFPITIHNQSLNLSKDEFLKRYKESCEKMKLIFVSKQISPRIETKNVFYAAKHYAFYIFRIFSEKYDRGDGGSVMEGVPQIIRNHLLHCWANSGIICRANIADIAASVSF